ncbi:hypothetical protein [Paludibacterium paludis]|uniref:Uncharacterized protein n=1 Tax=Paludibacterium paludis TaxID=1225769 RepID=A0A918NYV0_9NEIS|nr:hypothetical protein [Paludibacterium paludis]GGY07146.1 hypothetical protein GCM10011289_07190 [Paludibacterium paludis]
MEFTTVRGLVGWAFQMSAAVPVSVQTYRERVGSVMRELTPAEQKNMAMDILAKVGRLKPQEYAAIAAYFTRDIRAINEAAKALPAGWPTPLRRELTRGWANDQILERDQKTMAETYLLSEPSMTRRKQQAFRLLDAHFVTGLNVLEVQVQDCLSRPVRRDTAGGRSAVGSICYAA